MTFEKKHFWHWPKINSFVLLGNQGVIGDEWHTMAESVDIREWVKTGDELGDPYIAEWDYDRNQSGPGDFTIYFLSLAKTPNAGINIRKLEKMRLSALAVGWRKRRKILSEPWKWTRSGKVLAIWSSFRGGAA